MLRAAALPIALAALAACADPDPALRVGDVHFTDDQVSALAAEQIPLLADLAALGQLVAAGDEDSLVGPLAGRAEQLSRLRSLPYFLAARARGIEEDSLRALYASTPEWELTVRHVVRLVGPGASEARRAAALANAREAERRARSGENFAAIASDLSEEPGAAEVGGLLEPGRRGSWVEPFWLAALALRPGEVSPVVETEYGYHVLLLEDRRPVPFAEAHRLPLLQGVIGPAAAMEAMEAWAGSRPPITLDPPTVLAARDALRRGEAPDSIVLARTDAGDSYDAKELAMAWGALEPPERRALEGADDGAFGRWVADDVRQRLWADEAARLGAQPVEGARAAAAAEWRGRVGMIADGVGFSPGMDPDAIGAASLAALGGRGQEALIARAELPGLRPLLRSIHPPNPRDPGTSS